MPFSVIHLILFLLLLFLLIFFVQLGAMAITFEKLGLSPSSGFSLLFLSLFGSAINLPLFRIKAEAHNGDAMQQYRGLLRHLPREFEGYTLIAVNVGGALVPTAFSVYLMMQKSLAIAPLLLSVALVSLVCYLFSRPIPGLGIGMPIIVAPLTAAFVAVSLGGENSAAFAYISGTLGVLLGADIFRFKDIRRLGAPIATIGGAGTFDGIFITGIVAVLLT